MIHCVPLQVQLLALGSYLGVSLRFKTRSCSVPRGSRELNQVAWLNDPHPDTHGSTPPSRTADGPADARQVAWVLLNGWIYSWELEAEFMVLLHASVT